MTHRKPVDTRTNYIGNKPLFIRAQTAEYTELSPEFLQMCDAEGYRTTPVDDPEYRRTRYFLIRACMGAP